MSEHTPGPWTVGKDDWNPQVLVVEGPDWLNQSGRAAADARLIAAAPDLLEALERVLPHTWHSYCDDECGEPEDTRRAEAVIAKARGEA